MSKPVFAYTPAQLAALSLQSGIVISLVRRIPAGDDQYLDKLYHYGHGVIPGSVVQAVYNAIRKNPQMTDAALSEHMLGDAALIAQLEANLRWEYDRPDMAQKLRNFERLLTPAAPAPTRSGVCRHDYDKLRFSACPYCNPPAFEEVCNSRIKRLQLSASIIAGDYKRIEYGNGRLKYAQGFRTIAPLEYEVPFADAQVDGLSKAIIACHIERWRSCDSVKPLRLGMNQPSIEVEFENGRLLAWQNDTPQDEIALARVEQILSDALGLSFDLTR